MFSQDIWLGGYVSIHGHFPLSRNPLYVYYFWQNVYNHGAFFNFEGKTSGIKNLQLDNALSAIDIECLPLEKQNQIVSSLTSIDEKIKVNRQINDNLRASRAQSQTQFELCQGAAVNADISPNLLTLDRSSRGAKVRLAA